METISMANRNGRYRITRCACDQQQLTATLGLPPEGVHERASILPQGAHIEEIRTQIEHRVTRTQAKIVNRAGILESEALAIEQLCVGIETIHVEPWLRRRERDAEV